jgi:hypothetical protein
VIGSKLSAIGRWIRTIEKAPVGLDASDSKEFESSAVQSVENEGLPRSTFEIGLMTPIIELSPQLRPARTTAHLAFGAEAESSSWYNEEAVGEIFR